MHYVLIFTIISIIVSLIISLLLEKLLKNREKIDESFVFCFWKLSYRRKFIRTLWMLPFLIIVIFYIHITFKSYLFTGIIGAILSTIFILQAVYYYKKWKMEK
ncbi:MAG: hypothetical protein Q4D45_14350 [Lachnospiraceae bacterium]|nr:hypothetical protein [Lachnospiraceae bacterium]MDY3747610.1 hypothetical protein [Lachnospiraceae bacterium]